MSGTAITLDPLVPWLAIAALATLAAVVLSLGSFHRARGTLWRGIALVVGLLTLANPVLLTEEREPLRDVAVILVDRTESQAVARRGAATEAALAAVQERVAALTDLDVRVVAVGDSAAAEVIPEGTRLFSALAEAVGDVPGKRLAGVIAITDGQVHDAPAEPPFAAPLHVLLTGAADERDRRLTVEQAPRYGMVGTTQTFTIRVDDEAARGPITVAVHQDGSVVAVVQVQPGAAETVPFVIAHGGQTILEIVAEPADGELTERNNRALVEVNGIRDRLRVLLVSGEPHPGERTWRALLKADPSVDLVHFTILRPPEKQDGTPVGDLSLIAFPVRELFEVKLSEFDLIIFDRYQRRWLLPTAYLQNIADYVLRGGAVLEAAGPAFGSNASLFWTPLGAILPAAPSGGVLLQPFRPSLTDAGRRHPVTADLPGAGRAEGKPSWGRWFRLVETEAREGTTLLAGPAERPLLVLARIGEGRVAQILSDHGWLWARGYEGGGPQAELLRRIAHWLMKEPDLEENDLRASAAGGRVEVVRRSVTPGERRITVTAPSGRRSVLDAVDEGGGRARAGFLAEEAGIYRFSDGELEAVAAAGALNSRELADVRASAAPLAALVAASGGTLRWLESEGIPRFRRVSREGPAGGTGWAGLRDSGAYRVTGLHQLPLTPAAVVLLLLLGGLTAAWWREAR
ncbi:MAG: hypothetical protein FJX56_11790 [Alphaproteobacteria bacterium]|nr:hypothetical protein [Alphaproteobacteria bacterium]